MMSLSSILQKLGLQGVKRVHKLFYRIPISVLQEIVKYDCFTIGSDMNLQVLFHYHRQFPKVRTPELLAKLVNMVSSSGGSNRNIHTIGTVAGSNSRPVGVSSSVPVNEPLDEPVASPSFAVDLNCSGGGEVGIVDIVSTSLQCAALAGLGDALLDDVDDDDVEPDMIADDSGDDIAASDRVGAGGGSSSGTQQYPPHFSSLHLITNKTTNEITNKTTMITTNKTTNKTTTKTTHKTARGTATKTTSKSTTTTTN
ncbi:hypothetical protein Ahy_A02g006505 isoform D [Arachis hypogaea]|uniref:Uncharacterized protein n=1 Tax=Arachis hypogaea TaxID=3818 RepID=A0A445E9Z9_ARAHY|nr:hypothetical protein Ahy_A02g006505 isoform D [Arachis hypogaea]